MHDLAGNITYPVRYAFTGNDAIRFFQSQFFESRGEFEFQIISLRWHFLRVFYPRHYLSHKKNLTAPTVRNMHGFRNSHQQQNSSGTSEKKYPLGGILYKRKAQSVKRNAFTNNNLPKPESNEGNNQTFINVCVAHYALRFALKKYISIKIPITIRAVSAVQGVSRAILMATKEYAAIKTTGSRGYNFIR